jgi:hypothetical protein
MLTDAGSIPAASTNNETPTVLGWGFFLPDRAGSRVLLGVPAEACGLRRSASQPFRATFHSLLAIPRSDLAP